MRNNTFPMIFVVFFLLVPSSLANEFNKKKLAGYIDIITASLESADQSQKAMWSYSLVQDLNIDGDKEISVEKYLPLGNGAKYWVLEQLNHRKPTNEDVEQYLNEKADRAKDELDSGIENQLLNLIDFDSINIDREQGDYVFISFKGVFRKFGSAAKGKIDGVLILDKNKGYITHLELKNNEEFTVKMLLGIKKWHLKISFDKIKKAIVLRRRTSTLFGTAMMFASVAVTMDLTFNNYVYVGPNH